jgi:hypothetical protein
MIYAFSGGFDLSRKAGEILDSKVQNGAIESTKRRFVLSELGVEAVRKFPPRSKRYGGSLLVIFYDSPVEMWTLNLDSSPIHRSFYAFGGFGSFAMFLVLRYRESRSVEQLKFLTAHSVIEAHLLHPSVVKGLELWSYTESQGVKQATDLELEELKARSTQFSESIKTQLFEKHRS